MPRPRGARRAGVAWLLALAAAWLLLATPARATADSVVTLAEGSPVLAADRLAQAWLDPTGRASFDEVRQAAATRFAPVAADTVFALAQGKALWLRLRLARTDSDQQWLLELPNPLLDRVTVWQRGERAGWHAQTAGDTVAVDSWPEPGRYPAFRLDLPDGQVREVYLQLRSAIPTSVPLRLASDVAHGQQQQLESLGLGLAFGALLLLIAACVAQSWAYDDRVYAWYALYATFGTACAAAYTGVAAHLVWSHAGAWADAAPGVLALLAAGAAVLLVREVSGLAARHPVVNRLARLAGWSGLPLAILYLLVPRPAGIALLSAAMAVATVTSMGVAWLVWRRRDVVGLWVLAAYLPLSLGVAAAIVRLLGLLPISFATQYLALAALAALVAQVLLLVALSIRSRDRHGVRLREQTLSSQDALTGLLASHLFHDRLHQAVSRYQRDHEDAAVVLIDLVNHGRIKAQHGAAVAEQSLLRSVIKLRRVLRDVDSAGRLGEARFGLILEGVTSRVAVTDRAARLIAAGLMPLPGLQPDVTLHFHVAAVLLRERLLEPRTLTEALGDLLAGMSSRTRRPIRFLQPEDTMPVALEPDSELPDNAAATQPA